jgi:hypothetical protein
MAASRLAGRLAGLGQAVVEEIETFRIQAHAQAQHLQRFARAAFAQQFHAPFVGLQRIERQLGVLRVQAVVDGIDALEALLAELVEEGVHGRRRPGRAAQRERHHARRRGARREVGIEQAPRGGVVLQARVEETLHVARHRAVGGKGLFLRASLDRAIRRHAQRPRGKVHLAGRFHGGQVDVGVAQARQQVGADAGFVLFAALQARHDQQRDAEAFRRHVARRARAAVDVFEGRAQRAVQADQGADTVVAGRGQHVRQTAPAVADHADAAGVGLVQRVGVADQEADVVGLGFGAFEVGRHRMRARTERGAGDHDVAVAGQVFAQVGVLDRVGAVAGRIDHDRELAGTLGRIAQGAHALLHFASHLGAIRTGGALLDQQVGGVAHLLRRAAEFLLGRHGRDVVAVVHHVVAGDRRIPDQGLQRTRTVAAAGLRRDRIARRLVDAGAVVLLAHVEADAEGAGRGVQLEVGAGGGGLHEDQDDGGQVTEHAS